MKSLLKTKSSKIITVTITAIAAIVGYPLLMHHFLHNGQYQDLALVYLLQFLVTQLLLATVFASTLFAGKTPLITHFAQMAYGLELPSEVDRYCRNTTWAWALFFVALALISIILYLCASAAVWSFFCNILYFPLIAMMFVVEYVVRSYSLPHLKRLPILKGWNLYWENKKSS
ncbi:hypothetical protein ABF87_00020 [Nitrosomonas sp. JL21]|uniref:hypothetical protein n=1 Tax=Nitrosomonas sp. JL21 TaxID=153949 RepID=UPI00136DF5DD|nr:hypothetical protein [Nitrosomonas sp. JL21]MBL8498125.1 hypothetical protein [Nitrosomonas sp.]MCC7090708.1 hypothetical protein [Nitrosomonas sp.]MXS76361.1 hypothetical protein [Nitrosomonas sp. JL21]